MGAMRYQLLPETKPAKFTVRNFAKPDFAALEKLHREGLLSLAAIQQIKAFFLTNDFYHLLIVHNNCERLPWAIVAVRLVQGVAEIIWEWCNPDSPVSDSLIVDIHGLDGQKFFS